MKVVIGTIYSTLTGEPLAGATVQEVGSSVKTVTDSKGNFSMGTASELSYLKISALEHKDKTVQVAIFSIANFENLDPINATRLPNMFITENKVNWLGIVASTAIISAGVVMYANSKKAGKTVKAKI